MDLKKLKPVRAALAQGWLETDVERAIIRALSVGLEPAKIVEVLKNNLEFMLKATQSK